MQDQLTSASAIDLSSALHEARERTLELISDLTDEQMIGPRLHIVNPLRWEVGHVAWFQERWILRHFRKRAPVNPQGDELYDSARIAHDTRWDLPLPTKAQVIDYVQEILRRIQEEAAVSDASQPIEGYDEAYFFRLALFHEYMHAEAFTYTRQTLGYPKPKMGTSENAGAISHSFPARSTGQPYRDRPSLQQATDAEIPAGTFLLGSSPDSHFVFDNEQWAHPVVIRPFLMARFAVTQAQFRDFVEDGGYQRRELWTPPGWHWRESAGACHPIYWRKQSPGSWMRRHFDEWIPLEDRLPVIHVSWYEADAYCRWAGRRLPTEAEWEIAASAEPASDGGFRQSKRLFPWGGDPPTPDRANLEWRAMGCIEVDALPAGDSAFGCRQMIGNVWEWTATNFGPYPGFSPGPYKEYSEPWFGDHKVLRGGCWTTRPGLIRNTYRNFYQPHRCDVWAGFRTCAL
ncbi:MAG TPA: selenoneine synthase SenA [Terriglobia bacterium]|nr:selenoneine synthase SenA [Terriglobia bacterium]